MSVGSDIKEVYRDVGSKIQIIRDTRKITEYIKYVLNAQVTKPFIREFFLDGEASYDTAIEAGDIIKMVTSGIYYMIMNKTPYILENEIIKNSIVIYKTNVQLNIDRPSEIKDEHTYLRRTTWNRVKSGAYALLTSPLFGISLETEEEIGLLDIKKGELYVPSSYGIKVLDRIFILGTDEYYRVTAIKPRRYENIDVVDVDTDTRPPTTTTTTSTTTTTTT